MMMNWSLCWLKKNTWPGCPGSWKRFDVPGASNSRYLIAEAME